MSPERMSAEQGERCQLCGSLVEVVSSDEGTSYYRPAEQGDVEVIRAALTYKPQGTDPWSTEEAIAALDRLAAALERAERERDNANIQHLDLLRRAESAEQERDESDAELLDVHNRAEKAERALAEMRDALTNIAGYGISPNDGYPVVSADVVKVARAVLRPSEDTE